MSRALDLRRLATEKTQQARSSTEVELDHLLGVIGDMDRLQTDLNVSVSLLTTHRDAIVRSLAQAKDHRTDFLQLVQLRDEARQGFVAVCDSAREALQAAKQKEHDLIAASERDLVNHEEKRKAAVKDAEGRAAIMGSTWIMLFHPIGWGSLLAILVLALITGSRFLYWLIPTAIVGVFLLSPISSIMMFRTRQTLDAALRETTVLHERYVSDRRVRINLLDTALTKVPESSTEAG